MARGLDERRLRRNAGKQALSRLEIGDGLELDRRSRLRATTSGSDSADTPTVSGPDLPNLQDDTEAVPSDYRVGSVSSTTTPTGTTLPDLVALQGEVEAALEDIRENFATLTKRINELTTRIS